MLDDALDLLVCPHCGGSMARGDGTVRCSRGHTFDIAKQGYVNLLSGGGRRHVGDDADMVRARVAFFDGGHYDPIVRAVAAEVTAVTAPDTAGCIADIGAGTGHYLAAVLDRLPGHIGLALDVSKHALRRAARAHPRVTAAACDVWEGLPVRSGSVSTALSVFAPRNAEELRRVLRPAGTLVVVTPTPRHLADLIPRLDLLTVDPRKADRLDEQLGPFFTPAAHHTVEWTTVLGRPQVHDLVGMGPSARHTDDTALDERIAALTEPVTVTASFTVARHHPR